VTTLQFDCPRCHQPVDAPFYGPCATCKDQLRATMFIDSRQVEAAEYEPKMNVVPNQVATKD
jgi:hypothetical protein